MIKHTRLAYTCYVVSSTLLLRRRTQNLIRRHLLPLPLCLPPPRHHNLLPTTTTTTTTPTPCSFPLSWPKKRRRRLHHFDMIMQKLGQRPLHRPLHFHSLILNMAKRRIRRIQQFLRLSNLHGTVNHIPRTIPRPLCNAMIA